MEKEDFVRVLKDFRKDAIGLQKACQKVTYKQIQAKQLLAGLESLATRWFEQLEPTLRSTFHLGDDVLDKYREPFGKILELSGGKPSKRVVLTILESMIDKYHAEILVPVQKHQAILAKFPSLDIVLSHAMGLEIDYMTEAIECARLGKLRAAVILGWCATVNRLHLRIENDGFDKFNQATVHMSAIQTGRYKRFNKKFEIHNLSDLRMSVFDGDLFWVLEFLGTIDGNQHERLEICFTMRNTCAHPGDATITDENLLSFFSDIDALVFANPKFALPTVPSPTTTA
jgi:hypothetical protein